MKVDSKQLCSLIVLAAFLFLGGSLSAAPWEGTASIAPEGELPASGFFIATNSYPRNTLVDITNLETNQSTRVIVSGSLNSQGLMAIVSREAANLIGMKSGAITMISIVQPTEPIAYYRFTEGLLSGNPVYDSGNAARDKLYSEDTFVPIDGEKTEPVTVISGPRYILEPEWQNREIVDFYPDTVRRPPAIEEPDNIVEDNPDEKEPDNIVEDNPDEKEPDNIVEDNLDEKEPDNIVEDNLDEKEPDNIAEDNLDEKEPDNIVEDKPAEKEQEVFETPFNIVSAPPNPPKSPYEIDFDAIIPGIIAPEKETPPVTPVIPEPLFSVPSKTRLEHGYYVQIASYQTVESAENAIRQSIRQIESYGPVVFIDSDSSYKILLGHLERPLNQGESAAVLQKFKSIGYKDAFVRHVR